MDACQTPALRINEGDTVPGSLTGELSDDAGTAYDLAISVSLDTFNQMLAEAGTSEALNPTLDAADLTPWMLGLCRSPTDADCTTPLPATGKGLSAWIRAGRLDGRCDCAFSRPAARPHVQRKPQHHRGRQVRDGQGHRQPPACLPHGQAQLVIETGTASPAEVLVVNLDVPPRGIHHAGRQ